MESFTKSDEDPLSWEYLTIARSLKAQKSTQNSPIALPMGLIYY
jgi:hypothetical protein